MLKKRLIFHWYLTNDFLLNEANKVHLCCLKYYSNIFNEVTIILFKANEVSDETVLSAISTFSEIFLNKDITFKTVENNNFREAYTFKTEIVDKMKDLDGITFFGHNKGYSNMNDDEINNTSIFKWIAGMYYFSFGNMSEVEDMLVNQLRFAFYGPYQMINETIENRYHTWYAGTFFWINCGKLLQKINHFNVEIPKMYDRRYAELFPGNVCEGMNSEYPELGSPEYYYLYDTDMYRNSDPATNFYLDGNERKIKEYKELLDYALN